MTPKYCPPLQFFEGIALGSRLVDAAFTSFTLESGLVAVFALSAPFGMSIGTGLLASGLIEPAGLTFLFVQVRIRMHFTVLQFTT